MLKHIALICLFLSPTLIWGQSAKEELKKISNAYAGLPDYNYRVQYAYYGEDQTHLLESMEGISQQKDGKIYFKMGNFEQIGDHQHVLTIDNDGKYAVLDNKSKHNRQAQDFMTSILDLSEKDENLLLEQISSNEYVLKVVDPESQKTVYAYHYNRNNHQVFKIVIFLDAEETEVLYDETINASSMEVKIEYLAPVEPMVDISQVINLSGKAPKLKPRYQSYTFFDLTQQN